MTTIKDILEFFEEFAPVDTAMDFDNCGLLIGSKNKPVSRVLVALDITNEVVDEADRLGAELIIKTFLPFVCTQTLIYPKVSV